MASRNRGALFFLLYYFCIKRNCKERNYKEHKPMKDEFKVDVNVLKVIGITITLLLPNLWDVPVHGNEKGLQILCSPFS